VSRIEEKQKNISGLVDIFLRLPKGFVLDIYGEGEPGEVDRLGELIRGHERIRYRGLARDMQRTLRQYSIFLMTSRYEGFGQTLIEARSQGLPIVAYDSFPAAKWIVKNGETGYLVPMHEAQEFADAVLRIADDVELHQSMSRASLRMASETAKETVLEKWAKVLFSEGL
jgi:glycosyltransferase involved in cell wall biosynthesis